MVKDDAVALREARKQVWPGVNTPFSLAVNVTELVVHSPFQGFCT